MLMVVHEFCIYALSLDSLEVVSRFEYSVADLQLMVTFFVAIEMVNISLILALVQDAFGEKTDIV